MEIGAIMLYKLKDIVIRLIINERSPSKLALAFCVGVFVAFSPFIGLHTLMMLGIAWWARLNFAMIYAASHLINNPLTMGPLYWIDHTIGKKICYFLFGYIPMNPLWMNWVNAKIAYYTGLPGVSLWAFVIGGNLLGLIVSLSLYPIMVWLFNRILNQEPT